MATFRRDPDVWVRERCAYCHRAFVANSRPRWAFTLNGYPAGQVHATCATRERDPFYRGGTGDTFEQAWYFVWHRYIRTSPLDLDLAIFVHKPTEELSKQQQAGLDWRRDRKGWSSTQCKELTERHTALVREFHAWIGSL